MAISSLIGFHSQAYKMMNHLLASVDVTRNGKSIEEIIQSINLKFIWLQLIHIFFAPEEGPENFQNWKEIQKEFFLS